MGRAVLVLVLGSIHWFMLEAKWAGPKSKRGYTVYSLPIGLKVLFSAVIPLLFYGSVDNLWNQHGEWWVSLTLITLGVFIFAFVPPTILCSPEKLVSVRWLGIRKVSINWPDVVSMFFNPEDNSITIVDKADRSIEHTAYNVGRSQFLDQIAKFAPSSIVRPSTSNEISGRRI